MSVVVVEIVFVIKICIDNFIVFDGVSYDIVFCIIVVYCRLWLEKKFKLLRECYYIIILIILVVIF